MSVRQLIMAAGGGDSATYWIATLGGSGTDTDSASGIAVGQSGDVYISGYGYVNSNRVAVIAKYNKWGIIQWQRSFGSSNSGLSYGIGVDSSDNVYAIGVFNAVGVNSEGFIVKYNSSGTLQWQRSLGGSGTDDLYGGAVDSSGNVYVVGTTTTQGAGSNDFLIAKYNTSGTIQWQRSLGGTSVDYGRGIAVDSSGNVYIVGQTSSQGAGSADMLIAKYNTSGTIQWQRSLGGSSSESGYGIAVTPTGDVHVVGQTNSQGSSGDILIAKYNTSGTIQWQRRLGGSSIDSGYGIALDSAWNVYIVGATLTGSGFVIAKYNAGGTIQWQRSINAYEGYGIAVDSSNNMYAVGSYYNTSTSGYDIIIAKLPGDGTLTGTYGGFTYAAGTLTDAATTLTDAARTLTDAARTLTASTSTLTDSALSFTSVRTVVLQ